MRNQWISIVLVWALVFGGTVSPLSAQFAPAPNQTTQAGSGYPAPYPQGGDPQNGDAQNGYPQPSYPQNGYPQGGAVQGAAQSDPSDQQHAVGRLSVADGEVNVRRGDGTGTVAAAPNAPLLAQDHVQTAQDGRAEVELDYGNVVRLGANTDLGFADLAYRRYQIQVGAGAVVYRMLRDSGAQVEIDTPSIAIHPVQPGDYRITVYDDGSSQITVRSGSADIASPRGSQSLGAGQSLLVRGNPSDPEFQNVAAPGYDQLDGWSQQRDQPLLNAQSYRYVSPDVAGAEDLDANGSWVSSQYGQVWEPNNPGADWSPYSNGNWTYEPYYGWTWVDAAPWGWAPFHYGRWFMNGSRWCWWPGGRGVGFGWSPAVVGFFGIGAGLGWAALAPFEAFTHWWGRGFGVSVGFGFGGGWRGGAVWNSYRNCAYRGGALWAGERGFGGHGGRFAMVTRGQLNSARFISGHLPVSPNRASYAFSNRGAFATPRLNNVQNRNFFRAPQGAFGRTSQGAFAHQNAGGFTRQAQGGFGRVPQQSAGVGQPHYGGSNGAGFGAVHGQPPARSNGGWQSFGDAHSGSGANFMRGQESNGGWHNFGESQRYQGSARSVTPRPYAAPQRSPYSSGFGARPNAMPGTGQSGGPRYSAPSYQPRYSSPSYGPQQRYSGPSYQQRYSAPQQHYSAPSYQPHFGSGGGGSHYSQPHYSAPHNSGGGGHSGGGGGHSGGGGHHR